MDSQVTPLAKEDSEQRGKSQSPLHYPFKPTGCLLKVSQRISSQLQFLRVICEDGSNSNIYTGHIPCYFTHEA